MDHLIPRDLGGADDVANLWPQPSPQARMKDRVEVWLNKEVCAVRILLDDAQRQIGDNWMNLNREMLRQRGELAIVAIRCSSPPSASATFAYASGGGISEVSPGGSPDGVQSSPDRRRIAFLATTDLPNGKAFSTERREPRHAARSRRPPPDSAPDPPDLVALAEKSTSPLIECALGDLGSVLSMGD